MQGQPTHTEGSEHKLWLLSAEMRKHIRKNPSIWASRGQHLLWDVGREAEDSKAAMPRTTLLKKNPLLPNLLLQYISAGKEVPDGAVTAFNLYMGN